MEIRTEQLNDVARAAFLERLDAAFERDLADYHMIVRIPVDCDRHSDLIATDVPA